MQCSWPRLPPQTRADRDAHLTHLQPHGRLSSMLKSHVRHPNVLLMHPFLPPKRSPLNNLKVTSDRPQPRPAPWTYCNHGSWLS